MTCPSYPMGQNVLAKAPLPKFGPLIISEETGLPCWNREYMTLWRTIACKAVAPDARGRWIPAQDP